jgi:hypothetical protein
MVRLPHLALLTLLMVPLHFVDAAESMPELPPHPRLLAHETDWARLKVRLANERDLAAYHEALIAEARQLLPLAPVERIMTGHRLLAVSRELLRRVTLWGYAWRTTGEETFARRAEQEMLAAAHFADWNPSHFLDVGEATAALALGYDWLHEVLTPDARAAIRTAIVEKGLRPGLDPAADHNAWHQAEHNWSQVGFGGLTLGALAVGDELPVEAGQLLELARAGIKHGLKPYAPDGVYPEGPMYWGYGTTFQVLMIAALETALGTDWGLRSAPGFLASGGGYLQTIGPTGLAFNFSDGIERLGFQPPLFWFARVTADPGLLLFERGRLTTPDDRAAVARQNRFATLVALWWPDRGMDAAEPRLPLHWHGRGKNPLVVFRESWSDSRSAYLAAKAGAAEINHGHMDAGSFVYEVDGVRWAVDLGLQPYESLESKGINLFDPTQDSDRWAVYRLNNHSHNTLTFDGQLHRVAGHASVERFFAEADRRFAILDLSPVFAGQVGQVRRGFQLQPDRGFIVQDEIVGLTAGQTIRWQMATRAEAALHGSTATLTQDGRTLTVRVLAPAGARFTVVPADPPDNGYNAPNPGVTLLGIDLVAADASSVTLAVQVSPGTAVSDRPALRPLAEW